LSALIPHQLGIRVNRSIGVYRPVEEVYRYSRTVRRGGSGKTIIDIE